MAGRKPGTKKTGGRDFKPGQSGNPNGRPPLPADLREARALNKVELERVLNKFLFLSQDEIKAMAKNPEAPALEVAVAKVVEMAITHGDDRRLDFLITRLVGNVPKVHEHSGPDGKAIEFSDHEAAAKMAAILNAAENRMGNKE